MGISKVQPVVMNNYKSVTGLERRHIVEKQQVHAIRCLLNTENLVNILLHGLVDVPLYNILLGIIFDYLTQTERFI